MVRRRVSSIGVAARDFAGRLRAIRLWPGDRRVVLTTFAGEYAVMTPGEARRLDRQLGIAETEADMTPESSSWRRHVPGSRLGGMN